MDKVKQGINCRICIDCQKMASNTEKCFRCYGEINGTPLKKDYAIDCLEPPEIAPDWCPNRKQAGIKEAHLQEIAFLEQILHSPFFEFCLQVKERKQRLEKELKQ